MTKSGDIIRIATKLAQEHAPDLAPAEPAEQEEHDLLDELMWDEPNTLTPGVYYQDQQVYMTFPFPRPTTKKVGKGKDAQTVNTIERITLCITSNRDYFEFNEQEVLRRGFLWAETFIQSSEPAHWPPPMMRQFLNGNTTEPDPWDIYQRVRQTFVDHIEYPEDRHYDLMTLYLMMTYVFRLFRAIGYIHFNGTANSGKSQNANIMRALSFNPLWQSSTTASSMFRTAASSVGTLMFDEAESWESEDKQKLLSMIKSGYEEGGKVRLSERNSQDKFIPMSFAAYCPKLFFSIAPQDYTLQTRMIVITMRPAAKAYPEFDYRDPKWGALRHDLYLWAMYHTSKIEPLVKEWNETKRHEKAPQILNRQWQIALPLLVLADYIGGDNLIAPMVEWLAGYWETTTRNQNTIDRIALLLRALPRVLEGTNYTEDKYYPVKTIHQTVQEYLDDDAKDMYKTRTVIRNLQTLGFTNKRNSRHGILIQLDEDQVRKAIAQRRIDPFEEDLEWLEGTKQYQHAPPAALQNIWQHTEQDNADADTDSWLGNGQ